MYLRRSIWVRTLPVVLLGLILAGCGREAEEPALFNRISLATTTSTDNSGLLADILPVFTQRTGIEVDVIAVGTGRALELGRNGDVDVVLVHAREQELDFVAEGYGVNRRDVMYNDFVIVGPVTDPAGVSGGGDAAVALAGIASEGASFVSRGDGSGTNIKEQFLWGEAGTDPTAPWYNEAGQGMGAVLTMASELGAYTLTDRGTWLAMKDNLDLEIAVAGDSRLFNPYGVIAVNPELHPESNYLEAMMLIAWFTSPEGRSKIGGFTVGGDVLFHPVSSDQ